MALRLKRTGHVSIPKKGNSELENEDSYSLPTKSSLENNPVLKFAVADGATESSFSREWSDLLVAHFDIYSFEKNNVLEMIRLASEAWSERINTHNLPWYAQEKLQYGAYSSILGVSINLESHTYTSMTVGDSNLFHIKGNMVTSFPVKKAEDFNNKPFLISTAEKNENILFDHLQFESKVIVEGDKLILATDAIAAWFLSEVEKGEQPWQSIENLIYPNTGYTKIDLENWVNNLRVEKLLKNDDITLIIIEF